MILDELLKVINGNYRVLCNGKEIENIEKLGEKKVVVESVSAAESVVCIRVKEYSSTSNDLNEKSMEPYQTFLMDADRKQITFRL